MTCGPVQYRCDINQIMIIKLYNIYTVIYYSFYSSDTEPFYVKTLTEYLRWSRVWRLNI